MHRTRTPYFAFFAINHGPNGWSEIWPLPDRNIVDARATTALLAEARSFLLANEYVLEWASVRRGGVDYVEWAAITDPLAALPQWGVVHADHVGLLWRFQAEDGKWVNRLFRGVDDAEITNEGWVRHPFTIPSGPVARPATPATATIPDLYRYVLALFRDRTCHLMEKPVDVGGVDYWEQRPWLYAAYRMVSTRNVGSAYRRVSWEPLEYTKQPGFTPCGTAVSVLRSCFEAPARFFSAGPVQGIRYYWAQPGASVFPYQHIFWGLARDKKVEKTNADPGEFTGPGARLYQKGLSWGAAPGIAPDGTQVQFLGQTVCPWGSDPETPIFYQIGCDIMPVAIHVDDDDGLVDDTAVTWLTGGEYITVVAVAPGHVQFDVDGAAIAALVPASTDELVGATSTDGTPGYLDDKITSASGVVTFTITGTTDKKFDLDVRDASKTTDGIVSLVKQDLGDGVKAAWRFLAGATIAEYESAYGVITGFGQLAIMFPEGLANTIARFTVNNSGVRFDAIDDSGDWVSYLDVLRGTVAVVTTDSGYTAYTEMDAATATHNLAASAPFGVIPDPAYSVAGQRGQTNTVTVGGVTLSFRGGIFLGAISPPPPPATLSVGTGTLSVVLTGSATGSHNSPIDGTGDGSLSVVLTGNAASYADPFTGAGDGSISIALTGDAASYADPFTGAGDGSLSIILAGDGAASLADITGSGDGSIVVTLTGDAASYADPFTGSGDGSITITETGDATQGWTPSAPGSPPEHWYRFDEATGTDAEDTGTQTDIDVSTVVSWDTTGLPYVSGGNAGALHVGITGPIHDTITYPGDLLGPATTWSISFWVKYDTGVGSGVATILQGETDNGNLHIAIIESTGEVFAGNETGGDFLLSTGTIPSGDYHHVVVTYDNGDISIYIDGVFDSTDTLTNGITPAASYVTGEDPNGDYWRGSVDDLRIYWRLLDVSEIENLAIPTEPPTPLAYWPLDEASGTRYDSAGSNDLTESGTVTSDTGLIGDAAEFDGSGSNYLSCASNADLETGDIDFTIAYWVNGSGAATMGRWGGSTNEWIMYHPGSALMFYTASGASVSWGGGPWPLSAGWHLVIAWQDVSGNTINIQVDNGTVYSATKGTITAGNSAFIIGQNGGNPGETFTGLIDSVRFWKTVLTASERAALWNGGDGI